MDEGEKEKTIGERTEAGHMWDVEFGEAPHHAPRQGGENEESQPILSSAGSNDPSTPRGNESPDRRKARHRREHSKAHLTELPYENVVVAEQPTFEIKQWFSSLFPALYWIPAYNWRKDLVGDIAAGITVGTVAIPQSIAYASVAG